MKIKLLLLALFHFMTIITIAQNKILFSYDTAGNQIKRELCINCPAGLGKSTKPQETKNEPIEVVVIDKVSFFPNPVLEELNINWELVNDKYVENIAVYNLTGAQLISFKIEKDEISKIIPFYNYAAGYYLVNLNYNNGESKSLNIIKK